MSEESQLRIDALTSEKEALTARLDKLQDELKSEKRDAKKSADDLAFTKSKLEDLQKKYDTEMETKADSIVEKKVMDRVELFLQAAPYLNDIETYSKHTDREIMEIAMNSVRTDRLDLTDESDAEIKGRFKQFVQDGGRGCPDAAGVLGVIKRDNDIANHGLSLHEQMAKQLKEDFLANRAKARGN